MKNRKTPVRTCIVCREEKPKNEMIRVVKTPDGEIAVDENGKTNGRGAYVCESCIEKARREHKLEKALGCAVPSEVYDKLEENLH
ncbi:MAG: YlxR family protein [Ruminococcus sp.]|jgi:predicted RNA-binding protein YlxR (DUF448 family)|nr:YlxR family protein [Ruminococcus sp.]